MTPSPFEAEAPSTPIWVLLGKWHGDNQQLLAVAEALQLPFRTIPLRFNPASRLPPTMMGTCGVSWRSDAPLAPPWPRAVLAAGRRSVPAARWIHRQSAGQTRLIHFNRPGAPLSWFDLIVTTPQYDLPERPNVLVNLMPFVRLPTGSPASGSLPDHAAALPRPWTVVLVGGNSRPFVLDESAAALGHMVNEQVRRTGGSAFVLDSPRTSEATLANLEKVLAVPSHIVRWHRGERLYGAMLGMGDRFIVTADSVSMLTEALLTDRPVTLFNLPQRPDLGWRAVSTWRRAATRAPQSLVARSYASAVDLGLLTSVRDITRLHRALDEAGAFGVGGRARALAEQERNNTLAQIAQVLDGRRPSATL